MTLDVPPQVAVDATQLAKNAGIPVFVDAVGASPDFPFEELENVEIFTANEEETFTLTDVEPVGYTADLRACSVFSKMVSSEFYVLKLGESGVFVCDGVKSDFLAPYKVSVVDASGVGDVFGGAMMTEYMQTKDIRRSCQYANIASTVSLTKKGAFASVPTIEEIAEYIRKYDIDFR